MPLQQWPGYADGWEKQIRLESDTGDRSINRLAGLVANKVRDFVNVRSGLFLSVIISKVTGSRPELRSPCWNTRKMADRFSGWPNLCFGRPRPWYTSRLRWCGHADPAS